jgi:hypothetical protein
VALLSLRLAGALVILAAMATNAAAFQAAEVPLEYQVKAAFLFNFLKFVDWPLPAEGGPWVIGVLGKDPFMDSLEDMVRGKTVNGRPVVVRHYPRLTDVHDCHVLFVPRPEFKRGGNFLLPMALTVGESAGFLEAGGVLNFILSDQKVHFEANAQAAKAAGLHVSAQLLQLGSSSRPH